MKVFQATTLAIYSWIIAVSIFLAPPKLLIIAILAAIAMLSGALIGIYFQHAHIGAKHVVWGGGISSGLMIASTGAFMLPTALRFSPKWGGIGIAIGVMFGYITHNFSHDLTHYTSPPPIISELTIHSISTGIVIGVIYTLMPSLSIILGVAIFSHKFPAGYIASFKLNAKNDPYMSLIYPITSVGVAALPIGIIGISNVNPQLMSILFGVGSGVFIHVALDNLPECEVGSDTHEIIECCTHTSVTHDIHDSLRRHASLSTFIGILIVIISVIYFSP